MTTPPVTGRSPDSHARLLAAARAGSAEALGQMLQGCRAYLLMTAQRELRSDLRVKVSASDLVQETFADAHRGIVGFQGTTPQEFAGWLRGILANKLAHARRRYLATAQRDLRREAPPGDESALENLVDLVSEGKTASHLLVRDEDRQAVQQAMSRLPAHYRQVIQLRNYDLLPFEEIGHAMDRTTGQTRALWLRAIQRLTKELHGHDQS
ncbi:MAG: sigma-70 family RNA polymerase sigma factor [Pirellulales bacterium]|nr:sigma-70 family RNA polymerase sigma factor [Pirellulales bacterium]